MSGAVVHFEVPADDLERAHSFYREAFGWDLNHMADQKYTIASTTPTDDKGQPTEPGAINGGCFERTSDLAVPVATIAVDDIDKALATVESLGGATVRTKVDVMGMGFAAYFKDTEGNVLGLWENAG